MSSASDRSNRPGILSFKYKFIIPSFFKKNVIWQGEREQWLRYFWNNRWQFVRLILKQAKCLSDCREFKPFVIFLQFFFSVMNRIMLFAYCCLEQWYLIFHVAVSIDTVIIDAFVNADMSSVLNSSHLPCVYFIETASYFFLGLIFVFWAVCSLTSQNC